MAHYPKPFFRPARQLWYVQLNGKQINLGADEDAAFTEYHRLMQYRAEVPAAPAGKHFVVAILDDFLDWTEKHRAADTYRWYKDRLESFCKAIDATLTADQLKPHHVQRWVDNYSALPSDLGFRIARLDNSNTGRIPTTANTYHHEIRSCDRSRPAARDKLAR